MPKVPSPFSSLRPRIVIEFDETGTPNLQTPFPPPITLFHLRMMQAIIEMQLMGFGEGVQIARAEDVPPAAAT